MGPVWVQSGSSLGPVWVQSGSGSVVAFTSSSRAVTLRPRAQREEDQDNKSSPVPSAPGWTGAAAAPGTLIQIRGYDFLRPPPLVLVAP
ncbi:uncharacterized protein V6R79_001495 [Siganus canaliculatus]